MSEHTLGEFLQEEDGSWSCARLCAVAMIPALYLAIALKADAGVISAIVVGGIGSLAVRKKTSAQEEGALKA